MRIKLFYDAFPKTSRASLILGAKDDVATAVMSAAVNIRDENQNCAPRGPAVDYCSGRLGL